MRRAFAAVTIALLVCGAAPWAVAAESPHALEATARASVMTGTLDVQPAFDPALADSRASSSTAGAASLQSVVWPSFLVDAFFFLYGFQSVERLALGISEAQWPQGPDDASASLSDLAFANGGDADAVPAKGGRSVAHAGNGRAGGRATVADAAIESTLSVAHAASATDVRTGASGARGDARQIVTGVRAGPLEIESIAGDAAASVADGAPAAQARVTVAGMTVAGVPVRVDDDGVRAATDAAQREVDQVLAAAGITVRLVPGEERATSGSAVADSGGLLITFAVAAEDPTGTPRNVRVGALLGAASAEARAADVGATGRRARDPRSAPRFITTTVRIPPEVVPPPATRSPGTLIRRRIVVTTAAEEQGGARGAYGAIMLLALGLAAVRPLLRAASRI